MCGAGVYSAKVIDAHNYGLTPQLEGSANLQMAQIWTMGSQGTQITQSVSLGFLMIQFWMMAQIRAMEQICAISGNGLKSQPASQFAGTLQTSLRDWHHMPIHSQPSTLMR